jgi:hypothetical protein
MQRVILPWAAFIVVLASAGLYLANTVLYLTPPNPVKAQWLPVILRLAHPLFAQNWHLFAPNPIRTNYVLSVRCRTHTGSSPWVDATQPLLARHHRDRTSPMGRLLRIQQNAIRMFLGITPDEWRQVICRRSPDSPACRREGPVLDRLRDTGAYLLHRTASLVCDRVVGVGQTRSVQLRILMHTPPAWSRRDLPAAAGVTRVIGLPWNAYQPAR